ncbi:MAG: DUF1318 domain-containing protein [Alphaproteobacteria bacterium]|nr:DUF1318 domain-containing protein [Alphaproteobacteria bacterium]
MKTHFPYFTLPRAVTVAALSLALLGAPAAALADDVVDAARSAGAVGEQADGYLGVRAGQTASADLRARVDQINIRRRAAYTQRAQQTGATANEMAAAVACQILSSRVEAGEWYQGEGGQWRQRTASQPVVLPSFCPS